MRISDGNDVTFARHPGISLQNIVHLTLRRAVEVDFRECEGVAWTVVHRAHPRHLIGCTGNDGRGDGGHHVLTDILLPCEVLVVGVLPLGGLYPTLQRHHTEAERLTVNFLSNINHRLILLRDVVRPVVYLQRHRGTDGRGVRAVELFPRVNIDKQPLSCQHAEHLLPVLCRHPHVVDTTEADELRAHGLSRHGIDDGSRVVLIVVACARIEVEGSIGRGGVVLGVVHGNRDEPLTDTVLQDVDDVLTIVAEDTEIGQIGVWLDAASRLLNLDSGVDLIVFAVHHAVLSGQFDVGIDGGVVGVARSSIGETDR